MLKFILPLFALAAIIIPTVVSIRKHKLGKGTSMKRAMLTNICSFAGCLILVAVFAPLSAGAEGAGAAAEAVAQSGIAEGLKYLAASLSTGLATIGTGLAVGTAASAAIGATSEDEKNFTKSLIFVALGEGVAIYGLLISILILFS